MVREAEKRDLDAILELYLYLHEDSIPETDMHLEQTWEQIISDPNHHLIVNEVEGMIVSSCVCAIIPNLTRNVRPYAFVENIVTHEEYRGNGYAGDCLDYAKNIAENENWLEHLEQFGLLDSMKKVMLGDRLFGRAKKMEFVVFDSTSRENELREKNWNVNLQKAYEKGNKLFIKE
ncbi:MAG: GNAT family N-acetyltransferase [Lachnospiraceae bacterium]|nr:GNAT family N-acetyltransferase [Lachnospiraceae bacterium]